MESLLGPALSRTRRAFLRDGPTGTRMVHEAVRFYSVDGESLIIPRGLLAAAADLLHEHGCEVELEPLRLDHRQSVNEPSLRRLSGADRQCVRAIQGSANASVVLRSRKDVVPLVRSLVVAFGKARVVVVCRRRNDAHVMARWLRNSLSIRVPVLEQRPEGPVDSQCFTASVDSFWRWTGQLDWDADLIAVFPDARAALSKTGAWSVLVAGHRRVIGLLCREDLPKLSDYERMHLEALFGRPYYHGGSDGDGRTVLLGPDPHRAVRSADETPLDWKRRAIWANAARNRFLAEFAAAIAGGDLNGVRPWLYEVPPDVTWPSFSGADARVALLVESTEHAEWLHDLLPDWPVLTATPSSNMAQRRGGHRQPLPGVIVTAVHAVEHPVAAGVWLRADAGRISCETVERITGRDREEEKPFRSWSTSSRAAIGSGSRTAGGGAGRSKGCTTSPSGKAGRKRRPTSLRGCGRFPGSRSTGFP